MMKRAGRALLAVVVALGVAWSPRAAPAAAGLTGPRRLPYLDCTLQELFGRWLRASGGESAWKGVVDLACTLDSQTVALGGVEIERLKKRVTFQIQPNLRARIEFTDKDGLRTFYGLDRKGWYLYREEVPVGEGPPWFRLPKVLCDPKTAADVQYEIKGTAFWLGLPFDVQAAETKLRFVGFLSRSRPELFPLPVIEMDVSGLPDWPIDLVTVALNPETWLAVEATFRFTGEKEATWSARFKRYTEDAGIVYPAVRIFYKAGGIGERTETMYDVRVNTGVPDTWFDRPAWLERATTAEPGPKVR